MRAALKTLLVIEVAVCFGPMALVLMIGALLIPIQILALFHEPLLWDGPVEVIGSVLCGLIGLVTLLFLLNKVLADPGADTVERPWLVFAGAIVGALPLIDPLTSPTLVWRILGALPIVSGLHILFLSRRMLFPVADKP